jgi:hypothetical protein
LPTTQAAISPIASSQLVSPDISGTCDPYELAAIGPKPHCASRCAPRPKFVLVLQPLPDVTDPIKALRTALKRLLRNHGLRCLSVRGEFQICHPTQEEESTNGKFPA